MKSVKDIKTFLLKHKKFLLPAGLGIASVFLVFFVILPQISSISDKQATVRDQEEEVATLKNSLAAVNSISESELSSDFTTATHALPIDKDITAIYNALSDSAAQSNTQLLDFTLTVGAVYGRGVDVPSGSGVAPSINVTAHVSGQNAQEMVAFSRQMAQKLPLAEIKKVSVSEVQAVYEIGSFYKPVDAAKLAKQDLIRLPNQNDKNLLNQLKGWDNK